MLRSVVKLWRTFEDVILNILMRYDFVHLRWYLYSSSFHEAILHDFMIFFYA